MTGFKMGSAKKMKVGGLGAKPGIFGSATNDEPESATAVPASATAMPRRALSSGLPGTSDGLPPLVSGGGVTAAMLAAQAQAQAQVQAAMQQANLGAGASGLVAGGSSQMNVQAAVRHLSPHQ